MENKFIALDPSGNFHEGKGKTGWAVFENKELISFGAVNSKEYETQEEYWSAVTKLTVGFTLIVCESYKLQPTKSMAQSWSTLETPQLIGVIRMFAYNQGSKVIFQDPSSKIRFSDDILVKNGFLEKKNALYLCHGVKTNDHMRDAIRHGLFFIKFGKLG